MQGSQPMGSGGQLCVKPSLYTATPKYMVAVREHTSLSFPSPVLGASRS